MKFSAGWVAGLGIVVAVLNGCGGEPDHTERNTVGSTQQSLAFVPPINGGVLLVAGTGARGRTDSGDPTTGTLNDPSAVLVRPRDFLSDRHLAVADWGNNTIRDVMETGSNRGIHPHFGQWAANLLANPRAEIPSGTTGIPGWTIDTRSIYGGEWQAAVSPCDTCGDPAGGNRLFYAGKAGVHPRITQNVDVSAWSQEIDSGFSNFCFTGLVRSMNKNPPDSGRILVQSYNGGTTGLGTVDSGDVSSTSGWSPIKFDWVLPKGTRRLVVNLMSTRAGCAGCSADAYFDELQLIHGSCEGTNFVSRPEALASTPELVIGGKDLCVSNNGRYECPPAYRDMYVQALAAGTGRLYLSTVTQGLGWIALSATKFPTGPFTKLFDSGGGTSRPLGWANGLAVQATAAGDRIYFTSGWQYDPAINDLRGRRLNIYDCGSGSTCQRFYEYSTSPGFRDATSGAVGNEAFLHPRALAMGRFGDFFTADTGNHAIRRTYAQFVTTIGGTGFPGNAGNGGSSVSALFSEPSGINVDTDGTVYIADRGNNQIRKIVCAGNDVCGASSRFNSATATCDAIPAYQPDDQNPCTDDACYVNAIWHFEVNNGRSCSDNDACNGNEACWGGICKPGTPPVVADDNNSCTTDYCDPAVGAVHKPLATNSICVAPGSCSTPGTCNSSATCVPGPAISVDDLNACTADACGTTGVTHAPIAAGTSCGVGMQCDGTGACISTNVGSLNPGPIDRTLPTPPSDLFDDFLSGNGGGQSGCGGVGTQCTNANFVPQHMALVRGTVANSSGIGLANVTISVLNHPEFGSTLSLANGEYFIVVNGGGPLTVRASLAGYLRSDRLVNPAWGGTEFAADIRLIAVDATSTVLTFAAGGLASGSIIAANAEGDTSPSRQAAVYFPAGITVKANGAPITSARFRVTEYTVGPNGRDRMPADVAANTMYTYAAEFSLENDAILYDNVEFPTSSPVMAYVTNFLKMGVGETVPVGFYDRQAGSWQPMPNGRVVSVDALTGAVTGTQAGDPAITSGELAALAAYKGTTIWRLPLTHFSPLDFNLGIGAPDCETQGGKTVCAGPLASRIQGGDDSPACGSCLKTGSIIDVERQILRETFPLVGTPFSLNYSSENTLGYAWNKTLRINLEDHPKHSKLASYKVDFRVAGKHVANVPILATGTYPGWAWPKAFEGTWDGRDQDGRVVQGAALATLDVGAVYYGQRRGVTAFGSGAGNAVVPPELTGSRQDPSVIVWTRYLRKLQVWDASALGFGGWSISAHHTFDPSGNVIYMGDGTHRKLDSLGGGIVSLVAGKAGAQGTSLDGTVAAAAQFKEIQGLAVGRDGDVFLSISDDRVVRKVKVVNGLYTTVGDYAGNTTAAQLTADAADPAFAPNGISALASFLKLPYSIALHDDGRLAIADWGQRRIFIVGLDGKARAIAGTGTGAAPATCGNFTNDGPLATTVALCKPKGVTTGPDGSTYFTEIYEAGNGAYVARIDPAGRIWRVAGTPSGGLVSHSALPLGTLGTGIRLEPQTGIAVDRNNTVWIGGDLELLAIPPSGVVQYFPMGKRGLVFTTLLDLAVFPDGNLLRPSEGATSGLYQLQRCNAAGLCSVLADGKTLGQPTLGSPAVGNTLNRIDAIATGPDGATYFASPGTSTNNASQIFRVTSPPTASTGVSACTYQVPATDGNEYYCFDAKGQHRTTVNTFTGSVLRSFTYNASGLLSTIVEGPVATNAARTTTIDRSTSGVVKVISPNGQTTQITLDSAKKQFATSIAGAGTISPTHDLNNGLLTALTDADSQVHTFTYDNFGRLQRDIDPGTGSQFLTRTETNAGKYTVSVTTAMGKTDWFSREILANGDEQRIFGLLNGLTNTTTRDGGGKNTTDLADGTRLTQTPGPDPIWGMLAPYSAQATFGQTGVLTPKLTATTTRTSVGTPAVITDQTTLTGATTRTYQRVYSTSARTLTITSPVGRQATYTFDSEGRVVSLAPPGTQQIDFTINGTTGRVDKVSQGTGRVVDLTYSGSGTNKGFLIAVNDPHISTNTTPLSTSFAPDGNGRPLSSTRQSSTGQNVITAFDWTPSGLLKSITPPGKSAHTLGYDPRGLLKTYTPPTLGGTDEKTTFSLDLDRYLQSVDAPGWDDLRVVTDPTKGRTTSILVGGQSIAFNYYGPSGDPTCPSGSGCAPGHLSTIVDGRSGTTTTLKWNTSLPISIDEAGGTVSWAYNNDLRKTEEKLVTANHNSAVALAYDLDGLLTCASLGACVTSSPGADQLTMARNATSGRIASLTLGTGPTETLAYNTYGELQSQDSTPFRIDYEDLTAPTVLRDASGRVQRRKERIGVGATTRTFNYTYDDQGRLWKVDGAVTSEYRYDNNGNRTYAKNSFGVVDGASNNIIYDAQDRLTKYGTTTFDYTLKGDVYHRYGPEGTTTYDYDALGALRSVVLPDGRVIEYMLDGLGRRIGKKVNGLGTKQWFYGAGQAPLAEADGTGTIRMRFVYGTRRNVPDVVKTYTPAGVADKVYRIATDQLGSPRVLFDTSGAIFKTMEFDEFGIKLSDPTFDFPFGFAGGLYDPDTKLTRFGARDYDASIGRWVSKDPALFAAHGTNLYGYALQDPVNQRDPNGRDVCRNSASGFAHHDWITIDGDPNRSYGYWSTGDGALDLLGGPGTMFSPDPYAEEGKSPAESVCISTTDAEEKELEKWLHSNFGPAHRSRYFLGIMTCQDFAEGTMDQLERIQGSPWRSFVDGVLDAFWY